MNQKPPKPCAAANGGGPSRLQSARLVAAVAESLGVNMPPMRSTLLIALLAILVGCAQNARIQKVSQQRGGDPIGTDGTPVTPSQYLELLKKSTNSFVVVLDNRRDWIVDSDIKPLFDRLDSRTRCAVVVSMASSSWPVGIAGSSEGHEAALLIEGFRRGYYPPVLSSDLFQPDREDLRQWYKAWSENNQPARGSGSGR
jgi:hypothetical protein